MVGKPVIPLYVVRSCHVFATTYDQTELRQQKNLPLPMCTLRFFSGYTWGEGQTA